MSGHNMHFPPSPPPPVALRFKLLIQKIYIEAHNHLVINIITPKVGVRYQWYFSIFKAIFEYLNDTLKTYS